MNWVQIPPKWRNWVPKLEVDKLGSNLSQNIQMVKVGSKLSQDRGMGSKICHKKKTVIPELSK
jgi:hypothetical protein